MVDIMKKCFILPKIGVKSFGIGIQDICKVSVSNFGTIRWLLRLKFYRDKSLFAICAVAHIEYIISLSSPCHACLLCFLFCSLV